MANPFKNASIIHFKIGWKHGVSEDKNMIAVFPKPIASFTYSPSEIFTNFTVVDFLNQSKDNIVSSNWFQNGELFADTKDASHNFTDTGTFNIRLIVENIEGCADTAFEDLYVLDDFKVFIPNIFKPNSPSPENQYLTIQGGNQISQIKYFRIFNRFGDRVFEAENFMPDDFLQGWDGKFRNADAAADVYIYIVDLVYIDGTVKLIKGDFVLMR